MTKHICIIALLMTATAFGQNEQTTARLTKEVRHELVVLPYLHVFDNLAYRVEGNNVTLSGQVTRPVLKGDAERAVRRIEGVGKWTTRLRCCRCPPTTTGCGGTYTRRSTAIAR